jgi:hypothetical protein
MRHRTLDTLDSSFQMEVAWSPHHTESPVRIQNQLALEILRNINIRSKIAVFMRFSFQFTILLPLNKEAADSENLASNYQNIWRHIPDNRDFKIF